jgi:hypothetical protein
MSSETSNFRVSVPKDRYLEVLGFTIYVYLAKRITPYSGMFGGVRTLGQYIENFIYGKIAEIALQIFLKEKLGLETLTDVDLVDFIEGVYLPDLIAVKRGSDYEALKLWVEVKEVRRDQRWFLIPASAVRSRPYDVYVAVWVGLPDAHVAWLVKHVPEVMNRMSDEWKKLVSDIEKNVENVPCEIVGFVTWNEVDLVIKAHNNDSKAKQELNRRFGQKVWHYFTGNEPLFDPFNPSWRGSKVGENIGFYLVKLRGVSDWDSLRNLIQENKRLIGPITKDPKIKRGDFPEICGKPHGDLREFAQRCIEIQLNMMKERYGSIVRSKSWFEQPLST